MITALVRGRGGRHRPPGAAAGRARLGGVLVALSVVLITGIAW